MSILVNIGSIISGASPYSVWVCDKCDSTGVCQYIDSFTDAEIPYSFVLPSVYETYPSYVVKVIDNNDCEYCYDTAEILKQFQDDDDFDFMDDQPYEFQ